MLHISVWGCLFQVGNGIELEAVGRRRPVVVTVISCGGAPARTEVQ